MKPTGEQPGRPTCFCRYQHITKDNQQCRTLILDATYCIYTGNTMHRIMHVTDVVLHVVTNQEKKASSRGRYDLLANNVFKIPVCWSDLTSELFL